MNIELTEHAKERMKEYSVSYDLIQTTLKEPDNVTEGYAGRSIYQKKLNGYTLRVIVEENEGIKVIITLYKARSDRYGI